MHDGPELCFICLQVSLPQGKLCADGVHSFTHETSICRVRGTPEDLSWVLPAKVAGAWAGEAKGTKHGGSAARGCPCPPKEGIRGWV